MEGELRDPSPIVDGFARCMAEQPPNSEAIDLMRSLVSKHGPIDPGAYMAAKLVLPELRGWDVHVRT